MSRAHYQSFFFLNNSFLCSIRRNVSSVKSTHVQNRQAVYLRQKINKINDAIPVFRLQKLSLGPFLLSESLEIRNVARAQIPLLMLYVGWVCCWFSPLFREVFLRVLLKNQHFQITSIWNVRRRLNKFIRTSKCFVGKKNYNYGQCFN